MDRRCSTRSKRRRQRRPEAEPGILSQDCKRRCSPIPAGPQQGAPRCSSPDAPLPQRSHGAAAAARRTTAARHARALCVPHRRAHALVLLHIVAGLHSRIKLPCACGALPRCCCRRGSRRSLESHTRAVRRSLCHIHNTCLIVLQFPPEPLAAHSHTSSELHGHVCGLRLCVCVCLVGACRIYHAGSDIPNAIPLAMLCVAGVMTSKDDPGVVVVLLMFTIMVFCLQGVWWAVQQPATWQAMALSQRRHTPARAYAHRRLYAERRRLAPEGLVLGPRVAREARGLG